MSKPLIELFDELTAGEQHSFLTELACSDTTTYQFLDILNETGETIESYIANANYELIENIANMSLDLFLGQQEPESLQEFFESLMYDWTVEEIQKAIDAHESKARVFKNTKCDFSCVSCEAVKNLAFGGDF